MIYIHVGLGRTGSTFLQYRVFPKFRGIRYIQRTRFRRAKKIIARGGHARYLVSGEMDGKKLEMHMADFSQPYRHARPIIIFRRHDEWAASQFRRYIKNGHPWHFRDFFDVEHDRGAWKRERLFYFPNIETLETYFTRKPLVLFYDDLKKDPRAFVKRIADYCGAEVDIGRIDFAPKHASYSEKQLRAVYTLGKKTSLVKRKPFTSKTLNVIAQLWTNLKRYSILYLARFMPASWFSADPIFPAPEQLSAIREYYNEDWEKCVAYAEKNNPDKPE